jgi:uncharacterized damage-inducible protein DinB
MDDAALDALYQHDRWATEQLLAVCAKLTDEQLDRPFEMGFGSIRKTFVHMISVIDGWHSAITTQPRRFDKNGPNDIASLTAAFTIVADAFGATLDKGKPGDVWTARRPGEAIDVPRAILATHILTHGTHHRAQLLNMLRHVGVTDAPEVGVIDWTFATGRAKTVV